MGCSNDSWDCTSTSNGFRFRFSIGKANSNQMLAYTFGSKQAWLSTDSVNLESLVFDSEVKVKSAARPDLYVSVLDGSIATVLERGLNERKDGADSRKLVIQLYSDEAKSDPNKRIVFWNVELKEKTLGVPVKLPFTKKEIRLPLPVWVYRIKYAKGEVLPGT